MTVYENIENEAKKILVMSTPEESFPSAAFIIDHNKINKTVFFELPNDSIKSFVFKEIGTVCSESNCHEVVVVLDSWVRVLDNPNDNEYVSKNWDTERPSVYPESMRQNALIIYFINFKNNDCMKIITYEIKPDGIHVVKEEKHEGRLGGSIRENLSMGFIIKEAHKEFLLGNNSPDAVYKVLSEKYPNLKGAEENGGDDSDF